MIYENDCETRIWIKSNYVNNWPKEFHLINELALATPAKTNGALLRCLLLEFIVTHR